MAVFFIYGICNVCLLKENPLFIELIQCVEVILYHKKKRKTREYGSQVRTAQDRLFLEQVILVNFRKEILPFIPKEDDRKEDPDDDCSDILIVSDSIAIAAHNEDANVALLGHTYVVCFACPQFLVHN